MSTTKDNAAILQMRNRNIPKGVFNVTSAFIREARGAVMVAMDGRELIDFAGGIGVNNVGHAHPKVVAAIKDQVDRYIHCCFHVAMYEPYVELAAKLNELAPGDFPKMTMFTNSGAEAVENAVKIARHATGRPAVIAFDGGFHGRTLLTMTLTGKVKPYKYGFGPFAPETYRMPYAYCYRCPFGLKYPSCGVSCADYLETFFVGNVAPEQTAAVIVEPVQGEGGFVTPPPEYFPKLQAICRRHGIVFIDDEVQSGMGRTGKLFASEHFGLEPDIVTLAKGIASGLPLSGILARRPVLDRLLPGTHGGTYGGNVVACAAAMMFFGNDNFQFLHGHMLLVGTGLFAAYGTGLRWIAGRSDAGPLPGVTPALANAQFWLANVCLPGMLAGSVLPVGLGLDRVGVFFGLLEAVAGGIFALLLGRALNIKPGRS